MIIQNRFHLFITYKKILHYLKKQQSLLSDACKLFNQAKGTQLSLSFAAEWLLDNYYIIENSFRESV